MGRPKNVKPQSDAQVDLDDEASETPGGGSGDDEPGDSGRAISKAAAVREALALGLDSPEEGTRHLREAHGIEISRQMFSSYKAQQKSRDAKKLGKTRPYVKRSEPRRRPSALEGYLSPPARNSSGGGDLLESLEALKPLIAQHGADQVKRMVDLLG